MTLSLLLQFKWHCPGFTWMWELGFVDRGIDVGAVGFLKIYEFYISEYGHAVAQLVEALRYKPEGRGFDSRWYH